MGVINLTKQKFIGYCDATIEVFLYILIFCLPFSKAVVEISATFIILAWMAKKALCFRPVSTYLDIPIFAYILATFFSVIFSSNFSLSLHNFGTKTMEYILLYFVIADFVGNKRRLKNTLIVMVVSAAMIGVDGVFQYFFGFDFLRFQRLEAGRITGSFQMPGDLAGYLGPLVCLPLGLCFLRLKKGIRYFLSIETIILLTMLLFTFTRGAWLGLIIALCFLGLLENKKILYSTIIFLLVLTAVLPHLSETSDNILGRLKGMVALSDPSSLDRKTIWQVAVRMIKDRPFFGHGLSTFMGNFPKYGPDYYYLKEGIIPYAHNCYLQIAAESGIIGLLSFLVLIGTFFIYTVISLIKIKGKFYHAALSGISAGIIVTLVHSAVDTNLYSLQLSVLFWVMLGLNAAIQQKCFLDENSK